MAKLLTGTVVSDKNDKTIVVSVETHKNHPLYRKAYVSHKKFMAHDEKNEAKVGDKVVIAETTPLSARKRHTLSSVVNKAKISEKDTVEAITAEPKEEVAEVEVKETKTEKAKKDEK